ncbi:MAG: DUF3365 domain-containing protein, partial [Eudoraea sp.]|nr:DUF3365 domain-containing protein [Eudoraea sp.]
CKDTKKSEMLPHQDNSNTEVAESGKNHPGKIILETECYICHNPRASEESMIAPPMIDIKKHYITENTTKEEFTVDLMNWVNDPEQNSKMPGALKKFGIMPYIPYPEDAIAQIAEYLYDYDIEKPDWYDVHYQKQQDREATDPEQPDSHSRFSKAGMEYANAAKSQLGKNLIRAIGEEGTSGAISFCHTEATKLTDSVSVMKNAIIKRVTDKPRNQANAASKEELGYIKYYKKLIASETAPKPIVKSEKGEVSFYYPITTNAMCLQCHGKPRDEIKESTLATLRQLYPDDRAVGYGQNEVRGLWAINFDEEA